MILKALRYKTINIYLLKELTGPFFLGLLIFTFVLLMERVLDLIEMVINKGVSLKVVLELILYIMPSFLVLTIPMAVLVATLTAFGRLSTDSEVTAMKASGVSLYSLFFPVLIFAILANGVTFFLYAKALPWGNHNFRLVLYELARTKAAIGLKEHVFDTTFPDLAIYIEEIEENDHFKGVMISDSRDQQNPQTIFAKTGQLITDAEELRVILRLQNGASHPKTITNPLKYQVAAFPVLDILLSFQNEKQDEQRTLPRTDRDMGVWQLVQEYFIRKAQDKSGEGYSAPLLPASAVSIVENTRRLAGLGAELVVDSFYFPGKLSSPYLVEVHKRFSIPIACLVFGLIATPLGIQSQRAGKSGGYAISLVLLLIYYIFITAGEGLGDRGQLPVVLAVWTPNILLTIAGIILLIRMARK